MDVEQDLAGRERKRIVLFALLGQVAVVVIVLLVPAVGPNRYWVAGLLLLIGIPISLVIHRRVHSQNAVWIEALFQLFLVITLVHLVPAAWTAALCLGLMTALAPGISLHPRSAQLYAVLAVVLLAGMTFAAVLHDVEQWWLPMAAVAFTYPSVLFYAHTQLRATRELRERAQRLRGFTEMAGSVAHDFNNVLMGIVGHAEIASGRLDNGHAAKVPLRHVLDGASRASLLSGQLLSFTGATVRARESLDVCKEVQVIADLLQPVLSGGMQINISAPLAPAMVQFDRAQLQQVLMNLLINAADAQSVQPAVADVFIAPVQQAGRSWIELRICDRGCGIAAKAVPLVFDPFYTTKNKGHGLGLASCKRIMDANNSRITIHSAEGEGTRVTLLLEPAEQQGTGLAASEASPSTGGRLLVVDDEPELLAVAREMLELQGYEVVTAQSADAAVARFATDAHGFDAVLLDLQMPGRDGWDCLKDLRSRRPDIPVVICSGYDPGRSVEEHVPRDERLVYLGKPYRGRELATTLSQLLDSAGVAELRVSVPAADS